MEKTKDKKRSEYGVVLRAIVVDKLLVEEGNGVGLVVLLFVGCFAMHLAQLACRHLRVGMIRYQARIMQHAQSSTFYSSAHTHVIGS